MRTAGGATDLIRDTSHKILIELLPHEARHAQLGIFADAVVRQAYPLALRRLDHTIRCYIKGNANLVDSIFHLVFTMETRAVRQWGDMHAFMAPKPALLARFGVENI